MNHSTTFRHGWLLIPLAAVILFFALSRENTPVAAAPVQQDNAASTETTSAVTDTVASDAKSAIDFLMYLRSKPQDADACNMSVQDGHLVIDPSITNPAMSCPDMFAWKLFVEALQQEFWKNWAADQYTFPQSPLPLCPADAGDRSACCTVGSKTNPGYDDAENPGRYCPYYPGDNLVAGEEADTLETNPLAVAQGTHFEVPIPAEGVEPGRVIRQQMAEVVFRNKPMFNYIFENDLYNTDGLAAVFRRASEAMQTGAPYHQQDAPGELLTINLPVDSIMIKTNWVNESRAAELGLVDDPANPYIKMTLNSKVVDNFGQIFEPGVHYLVGIHISSKDIPNWVWATFEHVDNPGRCDMIGCNDSFGYLSGDNIQPGQAANFIAPKQRSDNLLMPTTIFDPGKTYDGDVRTPALQAIFDAFNIGSTEGNDVMPAPTDRAWLSYRLKGSQTTFTDNIGRPTLLGHSVTEGGFVSTSSCMGCHARAAIGPNGSPAMTIFNNQLAEDGYPQSSFGPPDPDWFYTNSSNPTLTALPFDFVWGIFFAKPLTTTTPLTAAGMVTGTVGATSATAAAGADPFAYCADAGAIDAPQGDFGPSNPGVPEKVAVGLKAASGASADAPLALFEQNSYWRCMDNKVYACFVGANLPCDSKADASTTPTDAMNEFCAGQPNADALPAVVTGRATVYAWHCVDGKAQAGDQVLSVDEQGYLADFWYAIEPDGQ